MEKLERDLDGLRLLAFLDKSLPPLVSGALYLVNDVLVLRGEQVPESPLSFEVVFDWFFLLWS